MIEINTVHSSSRKALLEENHLTLYLEVLGPSKTSVYNACLDNVSVHL